MDARNGLSQAISRLTFGRSGRGKVWQNKFRGRLLVAAAVLSIPTCSQSLAGPVVRNSFGEVGLLEMPSGHMADDGTFGFNFGDTGNYQRFAFYFQALPWLDTSFRFSRAKGWAGLETFYDRSLGAKVRLFREEDGIADVSVGVRDLVGTGVYGSEYLTASRHFGPFDASVGMGWGRLANNSTLPNPFGEIISSFKARQPPGTTGQLDFKEFFHGDKVGIFGGIQWNTPIEGLRVLAEYSSDQYKTEALTAHGLHVRTPVNVGLSYAPSSDISVSGGWMYGTTFGAVITVAANGHSKIPTALRIGPAVPEAVIRTDDEKQASLSTLVQDRQTFHKPTIGGNWTPILTDDRLKQDILEALLSGSRNVRDIELQGNALVVNAHIESAAETQCATYAQIVRAKSARITTVALSDLQNPATPVVLCQTEKQKNPISTPLEDVGDKLLEAKLRTDMEAQSLRFTGLAYLPSEIWVYYENYRYFSQAEAAGRLIRVLMHDAPTSVEIFHLLPSNVGVPSTMITVTRSSLERVLEDPFAPDGVGPAYGLRPAPMQNRALYAEAVNQYPLFTYSLSPKLTQRVFDPDDPIQFMFYADVQTLLRVAPGLNIEAEATGTLWSNYTFSRGADSALQHVRSDILEYLKHGKYGVSTLDINYRSRLAPTVFFDVRAGLLEDMFAGFGGQVLWRPQNSRFSFGADLFQVWQRGYHRLFDMQSYNVLTGHISAYYDSPWYDLNFAVHAGRYLAGDRGATFEISRRFAGGVSIGAWATLTNVPFSTFGEGSFDKGIIIHIPLQWGLPIMTQSFYDLHMNSLTRDGGQRLAGDVSLYDATLDTSEGEIQRHANELTDP